MGRLDNKVAIITGGARGMGASHVRRFVSEGAKVVFSDILADEGESLAEELGDAVRFVRHDVTSEEEWRTVVQTAVDTFGKLDILVNNAGLMMFGSILDMPTADFRKLLEVNTVGQWLGMKVAGAVVSSGGTIVNISSVQGIKGANGLSGYTASKFGVTGITQVGALEFGSRNVRVNSVHPGGVTTAMTGRTEEQADASQDTGIMGRQPLPRYAVPGDVTNLVLFLASDEASHITGAQFVIDGGMTAGLQY